MWGSYICTRSTALDRMLPILGAMRIPLKVLKLGKGKITMNLDLLNCKFHNNRHTDFWIQIYFCVPRSTLTQTDHLINPKLKVPSLCVCVCVCRQFLKQNSVWQILIEPQIQKTTRIETEGHTAIHKNQDRACRTSSHQ